MSSPEIFETVKGYPNYLVSNKGRVISKSRFTEERPNIWKHRRQKELRQTLNADGYPSVKLYNREKKQTFSVHQLVKRTFDRLPKEEEQVHHIDENKLNNELENLEYINIREHTSLHKKGK